MREHFTTGNSNVVNYIKELYCAINIYVRQTCVHSCVFFAFIKPLFVHYILTFIIF